MTTIATELETYLRHAAGPFDWAQRNCTHFASAWWQQVCGGDAVARLPAPDSMLAARRWVRGQGLDKRSLVCRHLGQGSVSAGLAQAGDLVMLDGDDVQCGSGLMLGICNGRHAAVLGLDGAVGFVPMAAAVCAWPLVQPRCPGTPGTPGTPAEVTP